MKFSEMLREARRQSSLSQKFLADRLGLKPPTISKYESGIAFPSPRVLEGLCKLFQWNTAKVFRMVYKEKAPDNAKPFLENFPVYTQKPSTPETEESYEHPSLQDFLQDPQMPNPTETELDVLMSVKIKGSEPTKWFYKSLLDNLRNEGLVKKKNGKNGDFLLQEST